MDLLEPAKRFDRFQQHHALLAVPLATIKRFSYDRAGNLAALISYYGFLSLFPLLLVFVTILGYVLAGNPSALESVKSSVLGRFPLVGPYVSTGNPHGSVLALVVGVLLSLYAGLAVTQTAEKAFNRIWAVPVGKRPNFIMAKLRGLLLLTLLGILFVVASGAAGVVSGGLGGIGALVGGIVLALLVNFVLFLLSFRILCAADLTWRSLAPGSALAAVLWVLLQSLGGVYINHIKDSANAYGVFALVIGVLAWLRLGAQMTLYSAELNVVLAQDCWPRSLFGAENQVVPRRDGRDEGDVEEAHNISVV